MSKWFGTPWGNPPAPVCDPTTHINTPVGQTCLECSKPIEQGDRGLVIPYTRNEPSSLSMTRMITTEEPWHLACFLHNIGFPGPTDTAAGTP